MHNSENNPFPFFKLIGRPGKGFYLLRICLTPFKWWKGKRYYLHILGRPDSDQYMHDHPWAFETTVLFGGYDEMSHEMEEFAGDVKYDPETDMTYWTNYIMPTGMYKFDRLGWLAHRKRKSTHAHKITRLHTPIVVTLVARDNTRSREWGFWIPNGEHTADGDEIYGWLEWWRYEAWKDKHFT